MDFQKQYDLVRSSRKVLLDYCATLTDADFLAAHPAFGRGSVRDLLVHNANTYQWWIGTHALQGRPDFTDKESVTYIAQVVSIFDTVDAFVVEFCERFKDDPTATLPASLGEKKFLSTPIELFTHAITHEFHHKGQILSLTRQLGYVPIDTDIIR